jgi:transglutaminase/protease-like cytokinesis protein 3
VSTEEPDKSVKNIPQEIEIYRSNGQIKEFIDHLGDYIKTNSTDVRDMIKKAHDWVARNIDYDAESFFKHIEQGVRLPDQDVSSVLKRGGYHGHGLGVCQGYAEVFQALCTAMDIECEIIGGYGLNYVASDGDGSYGNRAFKDENRHAWNKVLVDDTWYLIDCTWDAGYVDYCNKKYKANYRTEYLFSDPEKFIFDHFPDNPNDQLLVTPFSKQDMSSLFQLKSRYFDTIVKVNLSGDIAVTEKWDIQVGENFGIDVFARVGVTVTMQVYDENRKLLDKVHSLEREGQTYKGRFSFPKSANYTIQCFTQKSEEKTPSLCAEYGIIVTTVSMSPG